MPKTSHPFQLSLLVLAVSAVLVSGCNSSDNDDDLAPEAQVTGLTLEFAGRYSTGQFDESAAEITAFDPASRRAFVVNALSGAVDVLDMSDPVNPAKIDTLTVADIAADAVVNSVAVANGLVAVAVESNPKTDPGYVAVFGAADLQLRDSIQVGAQPDMVTFTPDGQYVLAANEGEPSDDYQIDPEGSINVVDVSNPGNLTVRTADFLAFNSQDGALKASGVRIYGPGATVAQDLEPEYITVSADSRTAWVSLQENNALAKLDIGAATVTGILPLGFKDYGVEGQGIDASDDDGVTWSAPASITSAIKDPAWNLYFNGPGKGICTRDGVLVFPAQYKDAGGNPRSNFIYSTDRGVTWVHGPPAIASGNPQTTEAQIVELDSGDLLISMRNHAGNGQRLWCIYSWNHDTETIADGSWGSPWYEQTDPVVMARV